MTAVMDALARFAGEVRIAFFGRKEPATTGEASASRWDNHDLRRLRGYMRNHPRSTTIFVVIAVLFTAGTIGSYADGSVSSTESAPYITDDYYTPVESSAPDYYASEDEMEAALQQTMDFATCRGIPRYSSSDGYRIFLCDVEYVGKTCYGLRIEVVPDGSSWRANVMNKESMSCF